MSNVKSKIESLLFISTKPMSASDLGKLIKVEIEEIKNALNILKKEYEERDGGVLVMQHENKYQMVSSSKNAELIQEFISDETTGELSQPSLETLTIIAYQGPISKMELNQVRGVNCALILRNLLLRGLIEAQFDKDKEETLYSVSFEFLRFLGITDINQLPDFLKLNNHEILQEKFPILSDEYE